MRAGGVSLLYDGGTSERVTIHRVTIHDVAY